MARVNKKPSVGQTLYQLNIGNMARNGEQKLTPVKVVKVGRKYFTCKQDHLNWETQFHIDGWYEKSDYTANYCLYESPQEWLDEKEDNKTRKAIERIRNSKNISHVDLKAIKRILEEEGVWQE